jgi:hypothetical protein
MISTPAQMSMANAFPDLRVRALDLNSPCLLRIRMLRNRSRDLFVERLRRHWFPTLRGSYVCLKKTADLLLDFAKGGERFTQTHPELLPDFAEAVFGVRLDATCRLLQS